MELLVLQSDFGLNDGAVSVMHGVCKTVHKSLDIHDLTHGITPFQVLEGSYRLFQTVKYWPKGTVFVSVVDPGVGTPRKSVVAETKTGHYIVTPDNGTLTHIKNEYGIVAVREINESVNRVEGSGKSYTFHGRDVYAYTGARLASGAIDFQSVGHLLKLEDIVEIKIEAARVSPGLIDGTVEVLDIRFGHLWTNINVEMFDEAGFSLTDELETTVTHKGKIYYKGVIPYVRSFGSVEIGEPLIYMNSLLKAAVGLNGKNFAKTYNVGTGPEWKIIFKG